jgi:HAMP domain-containing protein
MDSNENSVNNQPERKRSRITSKLNWLLFSLYLVIVAVSIPATYFYTKNQILDQANRELSLLVDMVRSVRNVVREDTRPYFMPKGEFFPPVVSSTVMAKTVASKFAKLRPEYYIRIVSDNPLNSENLPTADEVAILKRFRAANAPSSIVETATLRNESFLISSAPAKARAGCLTCHGSYTSAPQQITDQYGTISGFGYKEGAVVGASVVGVPMANLMDLVLVRSLTILVVTTVIFSLIFLFINSLVKRSIVRPLLEISESAKSVSRGNISDSISMDRNDEIGDLAHSIELMRRSLVLMVKKVSDRKS